MTKFIRKAASCVTALAVMLSSMLLVELPAAAETAGDFTVTGGTLDTDYTYSKNQLTVLTDAALTIKNTDPSTATEDRIFVNDGVNANITLAGVNIVCSFNAAFQIADSSAASVTVTLAKNTENTLISGGSCAGLQKNGSVGTLTIGGEGTLRATGGSNGAGIGGGSGNSGSNITITDGTIFATGGRSGAGIGGGYKGSGSNITISGGIVTATGVENHYNHNGWVEIYTEGAGIGGGASAVGSNIVITGGSVKAVCASTANPIGGGTDGNSANPDKAVIPTDGQGNKVYLAEISNPNQEAVKINGETYPVTNHVNKDGSVDGKLYVYLKGGEVHNVTVGSAAQTFDFTDKPATTEDLTVSSGNNIVRGTDYSYKNGVLTVLNSIEITIANTDPNTPTTDRIVVDKGAGNAKVTLAGVNIDVSSLDNTAAFLYNSSENYSTNVTIKLADGTTNTLKSGKGCAGLQKGGMYGNLTIDGTGELYATGGAGGAGIGGGSGEGGCYIGINNGIITATGGANSDDSSGTGAGIGGGFCGEGNGLSVTGGTVTATGGAGSTTGAGIGGGGNASGSNIVIKGGTVTANGGAATLYGGAGIGGGAQNNSDTIRIYNGTVRATGGKGAAGIGGGSTWSGKNIQIKGGAVTAIGDSGGAGIGGGAGINGSTSGEGTNIIIDGGTITAIGGSADGRIGAGIGGGNNSVGSSISISGGSVRAISDGNAIGGGAGNDPVTPMDNFASADKAEVYLLKIDNPDDKTVEIDGDEYTPVNHKAVDSTDGTLYAYLPFGEHTVKVGDTEKKYIVTRGEPDECGTAFTVTAANAGDTLVYGIDYDYSAKSGILNITSEKPVRISNTDPDTAASDRINVKENINADITLAGVNIKCSTNAALKIADNSTGNVVITLADGTKNSLISTQAYCAGLQKNGTNGTLTINGTGELYAKGRTGGAGIGSGVNSPAENITINGGKITAVGGSRSAGIGGGQAGYVSNITITGGVIIATGSDDGAGIGGGHNQFTENITISGGTVTATGGIEEYSDSTVSGGAGIGGDTASNIVISGGSVKAISQYANAIGGATGNATVIPTDGTDKVFLVTIENPKDEPVEIDGVPFTPVNHRAADSTDGNLYVYLKGGMKHTVKVGNTEKEYDLTGDDYSGRGTLFKVTATDPNETLEYGVDYTYPVESGILTILKDKAVTIRNTDPNTPVRNGRIEVAGGVNANITLAGVNISVLSGHAALRIADNSSGNVTITLAEGTVNILKSGASYAGLQKSGENGTLTIQGRGELRAYGGSEAAGIGGGISCKGSNITINSGTVIATGGEKGAGIGGGSNTSTGESPAAGETGSTGGTGSTKSGDGCNIIINGGTVIATGGEGAAGIGGGANGDGKNITINGGTVTAAGGFESQSGKPTSQHAAGIGGGANGDAENITINGGSVKAAAGGEKADAIGGGERHKGSCVPTNGAETVYLLVIANPDDKDVQIDGKSYSPKNHRAADSADGNIYAYLTGASHSVKIGSIVTNYVFSADKGEFVSLGEITAPEAVSGLVYDGTEHALVTAGSTPAGTLVYSLAENGAYTADIPTAKNAGTYTVWYRVEADSFTTAPASVEAIIAKAEISKVIITGIEAPVADTALDTSAQAGSAEYTLSAVTWTPADTTAKYDTAYTAKLTAAPADSANYAFSSTVSAEIDGSAETVTLGQDGTLTISHTFAKTARAGLIGISVTAPTKTEYAVGDSIDVTGGKLTLSYQDGADSELALTADMLTYDNTKAGTATVTVSYGGFTDTFEVTFTEQAKETVSAPVIAPNGGTFTGSQLVTITVSTEGAAIYYTTDGTVPTAASTKYTGAFTISGTTTVRAIAVKDGMNDSAVVSAVFTRKTSGGSGGGHSGGSYGGGSGSDSNETSKPTLNGKPASWTEIAAELSKMANGSEVTIEICGNYTVPEEVIKAVADNDIKASFVVSGGLGWYISGADISTAAAADLNIMTAASPDSSSLRGSVGLKFSTNGTNAPTWLSVEFRKEYANKFANLYRMDGGKPQFADNIRLGENSSAALFRVAEKGEYIIMLSDYSDRKGDADNDGAVTIRDALTVLRASVGLEKAENPVMLDYNGDGVENVRDAYVLLMDIVAGRV